MWLTRFSIQRPIIVAMLFIALAIYGLFSFFQIGRSLNPNVTFPIVVVTATYPGASPAEMERLVIKPIEDQIDGIDNLDQMSATAEEGMAAVIVQFKIDTNLDYAAIDVQRRVDTARVYMPTDLDPPLVDKSAGLVSKRRSLRWRSARSTLSRDRALRPRRAAHRARYPARPERAERRRQRRREARVPRAARPAAAAGHRGDRRRHLPGDQPEQRDRSGRPSRHAQCRDATCRSTPTSRKPATCSTFRCRSRPRSWRAASARRRRTACAIGDVATTEDGHVEQRIISKYNGAPTFVLDVNRIITADEIKSTDIVREQLKTIEARYPAVHFDEVAAAADYTQKSLDGVLQSLIEGIILTAVVLMLFLHAWRNALVVMIAIPCSLLSTFIVMKQLHFTLDIVSLMGLSLIIGILVDDSIVVLENITRHRDLGQPPFDAAITGRGEIGGAAVAITLVDVVVFLPIAFLSGIVGKYMVEFGVVVVVATLFSLFVSFTLTPMLAARWSMVKRSGARRRARWPGFRTASNA